MTENNLNTFLNSSILISVIIGGCVLLLTYIIRMLKNNNENNTKVNLKNVSKAVGTEKEKDSLSAASKSKKKGVEGRWTGRADKHNYTYPWLLTSLKGHTSQVLDMDFSSNGKYLASCSEEPDPGGDAEASATSSSSECNKENNRPDRDRVEPNHTGNSPNHKGLSRRQRKNRRREDNSPPELKKKTKTKQRTGTGTGTTAAGPMFQAPLRQFVKLNLDEKQLAAFLRTYLLSPEQMLMLSYPLESDVHPGRAIIFKSPMTAPHHYNPYKASRFDVNAREFVPSLGAAHLPAVDYTHIRDEWKQSHDDSSLDSGLACGSTSDSSEDCSSSSSSSAGTSDPDPTVKCSGAAVRAPYHSSDLSEERQCVRCGRGFFVASDGEYLTQEHCCYHWGKLQRVCNTFNMAYTCCRSKQGSVGCTTGKLHVWNGVGVGFNGPFDSYVRTKSRKTPPPDGNYGVYALDCEMCYTVGGLELTKITVIGADGHVVYDCFVKPDNEIIDYNTRFSGITAKDLNRKSVTKSLRDVQNDLMGFINADTILVGHGLENDLRALRIMHCCVVDTAVTFPHYNGLPYRRSLKSLASCYLKREIQCSASGHNSCEDARTAMELMLWKVRKDFRTILEHYQRQQ